MPEKAHSDEGLTAEARPATKEDAAILTKLVNMAGDGLPLYLWTKMAEGGDPWEVGRQRALAMYADWTDRIAAGELPATAPPRPQGKDSLPPTQLHFERYSQFVRAQDRAVACLEIDHRVGRVQIRPLIFDAKALELSGTEYMYSVIGRTK